MSRAYNHGYGHETIHAIGPKSCTSVRVQWCPINAGTGSRKKYAKLVCVMRVVVKSAGDILGLHMILLHFSAGQGVLVLFDSSGISG
jgi:hypothetical protein